MLAVDFDGTITTSPDMGHEMYPQPDAIRVIEKLHMDGVRLQLWTCRTGKALEEAKSFLEDHCVLHCFETINDHLPEIVLMYKEPARKLGADFYIDDKNLGTTINWREIETFIYGEVLE
ncbi:hypothetical protein D3C79_857220 [compost metagenome]